MSTKKVRAHSAKGARMLVSSKKCVVDRVKITSKVAIKGRHQYLVMYHKRKE